MKIRHLFLILIMVLLVHLIMAGGVGLAQGGPEAWTSPNHNLPQNILTPTPSSNVQENSVRGMESDWCTAVPEEVGQYGWDWRHINPKYQMYFSPTTRLGYISDRYYVYFLGDYVGPEVARLEGLDKQGRGWQFGIDTSWASFHGSWKNRGAWRVDFICNQDFQLKIVAKHSKKCLGITKSSIQNDGANAIQVTCRQGDNSQSWILRPKDKYFMIVNAQSRKCLDVKDASQINGANVFQWWCHGGDNQLWGIQAMSDGYLWLYPKHSGLSLDVEGISSSEEANVQQWEFAGNTNQLWRFETISDNPDEVCPTITDWKGEYWDNLRLDGAPKLCRNDRDVRFNWGGGRPDSHIPADHFSARWTRRLHFDGGRYRFKTLSDDGIRVWVDGHRVIDAWYDQAPTWHQGEVNLSGGDHTVKVEYYENGGGAVAKLWWERISVGGGSPNCPGKYAAEYFNNRSLSGHPVYTRCEGWPINHNWGGDSPGHGVPNDNFSARWTGRAHFDDGNYTFIARSDDGIRVWLDNQRIIDAWRDQAPTSYRKTIHVGGGNHIVKIEYYENGGGAVAQFRWEKQSGGGGGGHSGAVYEIIAKHSDKCLDVEGARQDNGANVQQWACGGGPNQRWRLVDAGGGYFKIIAVHSGKCLDVAGASHDNGANVIQWDCHGGDNQLWRLEQHGDAYRLTPKHSGKSLDVESARQNNGANVQQWQYGGGANQLWRLVRR